MGDVLRFPEPRLPCGGLKTGMSSREDGQADRDYQEGSRRRLGELTNGRHVCTRKEGVEKTAGRNPKGTQYLLSIPVKPKYSL